MPTKLPQPDVAPILALPVRTSSDELARYLLRSHKLYEWQHNNRPAAKNLVSNTFVLQDGPPYANGELHLGHVINKVLKDIICRAKVAQGMRVDFVPGSDCHGLPIELKILQGLNLRLDRDAVKIRGLARSYVSEIVTKHIRTFKSWAIMADWDNHWKTMDHDFELRQLKIFQTIVRGNLIFHSNQPVYWSPSTQTALAEAELEYQEGQTSIAVLIKIALKRSSTHEPLSAVIWTMEPWTLPANQAVAISSKLMYIITHSKQHGHLVVARAQLQFLQDNLAEKLEEIEEIAVQDLLQCNIRACLNSTYFRVIEY
jgi:isoleucyl-tRNA synthetase